MHYTVQLYFTCTIRTRAQSVRRQQEKRTSDESEMVTYNHDTAVVIATFVGALIIPTIKQTAKDITHQTNKLNKKNCTHIIQLQYILDH